ncbi:unnamed protein product [Rotaria sordida]|uniref:Uncharacterized protein n=1 Tax=Rotaria sordida TaxID=392033 RepID=A0A815GUQ3_9BILA|nr:unnamed protein product [Rotaria sordida]
MKILLDDGGSPVSTLEFEVVNKRDVGKSSLLECSTSIIKNFTACLSYIRKNEYRLKQNIFTNTAFDLEYILKNNFDSFHHYFARQHRRLRKNTLSKYLLHYNHFTGQDHCVQQCPSVVHCLTLIN